MIKINTIMKKSLNKEAYKHQQKELLSVEKYNGYA